ncbi:hypothetical protein GR328_02345 [Microvirga makkahensis]|uniref:FAD/NAD(P)-binding domain-containing protein n=1 Tax=Microvirga makkahensis TaxID=1128670 RepID=A0A7X3MNM3_9HYPH|nr:hypothetical protein [Microvirga makkahensis]
MAHSHAKLIVIGSEPSGYTAAIHAARALLEPAMISGLKPGGELMITTDVGNYPGFAKVIRDSATGHKPSTELFGGWRDMKPGGYLQVKPGSTSTNIPGGFGAFSEPDDLTECVYSNQSALNDNALSAENKHAA